MDTTAGVPVVLPGASLGSYAVDGINAESI